jgi:hypothetical protein
VQISSTFWQSKTLWFAALPAVVTTLAAWSTGRLTWDQALLAIFAALGALFVRDRIDIADENQEGRHADLLTALANNTSAIDEHDSNEADRHDERFAFIESIKPTPRSTMPLSPAEPEDGEADEPVATPTP